MPARVCTVTLTDIRGARHTVEVTAESVFEAAALALAALKRDAWVDKPGPATQLEVAVQAPVVKHTVSVQQIHRWLEGATPSPNEQVRKSKLRALLS